jgi:hypothetical protein
VALGGLRLDRFATNLPFTILPGVTFRTRKVGIYFFPVNIGNRTMAPIASAIYGM